LYLITIPLSSISITTTTILSRLLHPVNTPFHHAVTIKFFFLILLANLLVFQIYVILSIQLMYQVTRVVSISILALYSLKISFHLHKRRLHKRHKSLRNPISKLSSLSTVFESACDTFHAPCHTSLSLPFQCFLLYTLSHCHSCALSLLYIIL
jgi:hypothetical protein